MGNICDKKRKGKVLIDFLYRFLKKGEPFMNNSVKDLDSSEIFLSPAVIDRCTNDKTCDLRAKVVS